MQRHETLRRHADLMDRMATTVGVDLEEAALRGNLSVDEIGDAVLACTGCAAPEACDVWMSENRQAAQPPGYCRNAGLLTRLAT
jgi:hypothetical protein